MPRCARETLLVLVIFSLGVCTPAFAQDYPNRPIRALTATSAGGTSDVFMRVLGEEIRKRWGQPTVVENRPGGAMNVGGEACAQAPKDGYTICILPPETLAYNQFLFKQIPFDPDKDFTPITNPFFATQVMVANASLNVHSLTELAAASKAKPGTLSYTAASIPLVAFMNKWSKATGADIVKVPFRGGAEAVNNVLGGSTPIAFFGLANWLALIRNGTVNALAVDSKQRSPLLPNVPTLSELGSGDNLTRLYFGIVAPAGTPQPIVHKLGDAIVSIGADPEFRQKRVIDMGLEPVFNTPEQFASFLREDRVLSAKLVREAGMESQ
jgi:tripartite-type tricarboxylate transporter receptor subunit TctC